MSASDEDDATAALRELILVGERYRIAVATRLDVSVNESRAISHLLARGTMGQTDLASALGLTTSSTTTLLDRLEHRELVRRVPDPNDRRRSSVEISEAGARRLREVREWMSMVFQPVATEELPGVTATLVSVAASLSSVTDRIAGLEAAVPGRRRLH
jgi:DNA-binding MarR family transcriptional regulator